jgi:hypothetical protein
MSMKNYAPIIVFIFFMLSSGCRLILIKIEGLKQPKIETHLSLSKFLLVSRVDTSEILCFRDTFLLNNYYITGVGSPDVRFFNREKKLVDYRSPESACNAKVSKFIEKVDSINTFTPVPGKSLDEYLKGLVVVRNAREFKLEEQEYEAYMIVYWAKYLGNVTKSHISEWQETVNKVNKDRKKIRMILVNLDYQSFWELKPGDLPKFNYIGGVKKSNMKR